MWNLSQITTLLLFATISAVHTGSFFEVLKSDFFSIYYTTLDFVSHVREEGIFGRQIDTELSVEPEINMTAMEIIIYHGYSAEEHDVTTEDGFIITMQRLINSNNKCEGKKIPVLVQHGLMTTSSVWIINTPDKNLAYLLADAGYDVWLGNIRGSLYGFRHTRLSAEDPEYWNFGIDEHALYDLPAMIDHILKTTGFNQIYYVAFSMGTTMMFQLLSTRAEYNDKVHSAFLMAPTISGLHVKSTIRLFRPIVNLMYALGIKSFGTQFSLQSSAKFCSSKFNFICKYVIYFLNGFSESQLNLTRIGSFISKRGNTSVLLLHHTNQFLRSRNFAFHDFGAEENLKRYGQETAPLYDLSKITVPIALFWSENDYIGDPEDVEILSKQLKTVFLSYRVPLRTFSHIDFLWGMDAKELLYDKLIEEINQRWVFG